MLSHSCVRSPASHFWMRVRVQARRWFLWAAPPRVGAQRTHLTNICCSVHASGVLANTVLAVVRLTHCAQDLRSSLGICRMVGARRWWTSWRLGRALTLEVAVWAPCCCWCWFSERVLSASASNLIWAIGRQVGCIPWYRSCMVQSHSGQMV